MIKFHPDCEFVFRDHFLVVKQLRQDINRVLKEDNEADRLGIFSGAAEQYDDSYPVFKIIFNDQKIKSIESAHATINRCKDGFLIRDPNGDEDFFTNEEIALFIDLYERFDNRYPYPLDYSEQISLTITRFVSKIS